LVNGAGVRFTKWALGHERFQDTAQVIVDESAMPMGPSALAISIAAIPTLLPPRETRRRAPALRAN